MSKTKTKTTASTTPTNPEWSTNAIQGLTGQVTDLAGQDPQSFVAGASPLQDQQFGLAGQMGGAAGGQLTGASSAASGLAGFQAPQIDDVAQAAAYTAAQNMGAYYNPFQQQVAENTTQEMLRGLDLATNRNSQGAQLAGQYGGSRQGVLDANTNRDFFGQLGNTLGNLNLQGFNTAAQYGSGDADRQTGVSQFNAGQKNAAALANQQAGLAGAGIQGQGASLLQSLGLSGYGALGDAGATQQGLEQTQAGAPLSVLQQLAAIQGGLPLGLFSGSNSTGTTTQNAGLGGILQGLGALGSGLGAMGVSDRRLKADIVHVATDARGRAWYDFRYLWDEPGTVHRGVMAQEIAHTDPQAVFTHPAGFLMVDYAQLGA